MRKDVFLLTETLCQHICERCGQQYTFNRTYLGKPKLYTWWLCKDCKQRPSVAVGPRDDYCKPWQGEVDLDTLSPIKDGKPYKPGVRSCGHLDCVRPSHIIETDPLD